MSDTPYLLRMEMIKLAQQRAIQKYDADVTIATTKANLHQNSKFLNDLPSYPSIDEIISEAERMKAFVDGK